MIGIDRTSYGLASAAFDLDRRSYSLDIYCIDLAAIYGITGIYMLGISSCVDTITIGTLR